MDRERYFDNAATTPVDSRVLDEMLPFLAEHFGNANSIHQFGARAMQAVELARERVAKSMGAEDPMQILFTSGATEANNWVLNDCEDALVSPFEHDAIREPALKRGFGFIENFELNLRMPDQAYDLISVMGVNNEIGTVFHPQYFAPTARKLHSDMTQQFGKLPLDLRGLDYVSVSAHKLYGPKGVGALYSADNPPYPFQIGGEQEHGWRGGTLNVPAIVGFGMAAEIASDEIDDNFQLAVKLRQIVQEVLRPITDWHINGEPNAIPHILSVSFLGIEGESLVVEMDRMGFAVSAGAACSSHSLEPSHVLSALGVQENWMRGTVRISFGKYNSCETTHLLASNLLRAVEKLRTMS